MTARPQLHEVFTPLDHAPHTYVRRPEADLVRTALARPGRSVLVHGRSGAGKTTLVVRTLADLRRPATMTGCRRSHDPDGLVADAEALPATPRLDLPHGPSDACCHRGEGVPDHLAAGVAHHLAASDGVWVLEDVHKLGAAAAAFVGRVVDACAHGGRGHVIAIGTAVAPPWPTGPGTDGLSTVAVPPMTGGQVDAALQAGAAALGVDLPPTIRAAIVGHGGGHPSVAHALALAAVLEAGPTAAVVDEAAVRRARDRTPTTLL